MSAHSSIRLCSLLPVRSSLLLQRSLNSSTTSAQHRHLISSLSKVSISSSSTSLLSTLIPSSSTSSSRLSRSIFHSHISNFSTSSTPSTDQSSHNSPASAPNTFSSSPSSLSQQPIVIAPLPHIPYSAHVGRRKRIPDALITQRLSTRRISSENPWWPPTERCPWEHGLEKFGQEYVRPTPQVYKTGPNWRPSLEEQDPKRRWYYAILCCISGPLGLFYLLFIHEWYLPRYGKEDLLTRYRVWLWDLFSDLYGYQICYELNFAKPSDGKHDLETVKKMYAGMKSPIEVLTDVDITKEYQKLTEEEERNNQVKPAHA